ncbi:MAG TPA: hypothetical protein VM657_10680 [Sphingomonas sp.]|nr:hypothetical protein [Sphingomonas sp.]
MLEALLAAAALVQPAPSEAARFAPPLDKPFAYVTVETRDDAGVERRFRSERRLVFHKEDGGYVATVTLLHAASGDGGDVGGMFAAALGALEGTPIRIHLDRAGKVTALDDRDVLWERLCTGFEAMAPDANAGRAHAIAAALRALPAGTRVAMLGSLVATVIGGGEAALAPGSEQAVSLKTRPPAGAPIAIPATQRVSIAPDGLIDIRTDAETDVPATGNQARAHLAIERHRLIDPATGLVRRSEETRRTTLSTEADQSVGISHTVTTLVPLVS